MQYAGLDEAQAIIKTARININNLRYADDTTLMAESKKEPLDENEREEWKSMFKKTFKKLRSWHPVPSLHGKIDGGTMETVVDFILEAKSLQMVTAAMKFRRLLLGRKAMTNLDSILKSCLFNFTWHNFANKSPSSQSYVFSSSHVWMWELDYKESWAPKNWYFWTVVQVKTLESPMDCEEIQPVHPKGSQSWIFIGRTDVEAENPILCPPDVKNWLIGKVPDAGKDWRQEEKGMTEDEMVGWHHQFDGHDLEQALGVGDGQGSLACCSPWGCKESDTTEWLNGLMYRWNSMGVFGS